MWWLGVAAAAGLEVEVAPGDRLVPAAEAAEQLGMATKQIGVGIYIHAGMPLQSGVAISDDAFGWIDPAQNNDPDAILSILRADVPHIRGWVEAPSYDPETHRVSFAIDLGDGVVGSVALLGRSGRAMAIASVPTAQWPAARADLHEIASRMRYTDGHRYEDYDPATDPRAGGLDVAIAGLPEIDPDADQPWWDSVWTFALAAIGLIVWPLRWYFRTRRMDAPSIPDIDD